MDSDRRNNNFDILRLLGALCVLFTHSFAAVGMTEPASPLDPSGGTWGHLGVLVFFSISGYLISSSWVRDPSPGPYLIKRSFRIFPALAVMATATTLVIGAFATSSPLGEYFTSVKTWLYPVVKTLLFVPGNFDPPGIFAGNPWVGVNPSLWTLPVEFFCYVALMVLLVLALMFRWLPAKVMCLLAVLAGAALSNPAILANTPLAPISTSALFTQSATVIAAFFMGAFLFFMRERIRLNLFVAAGLAVLAFVIGSTPFGLYITPIVVPYIVLTLALSVPALPLGKFRGWDLSYAMYLYGFPIQQLVVYTTGTRNPVVVMVLALLITAPLAALSWKLIERPALQFGRRLAKRASKDRLPVAPTEAR